MTIILYFHLTNPFSLCIYDTMYLITIPGFSQKDLSLAGMNSRLLFTQRTFIKQLDLAST